VVVVVVVVIVVAVIVAVVLTVGLCRVGDNGGADGDR